MLRRSSAAVLVTLLLASAIHADWHLARPLHHRLSLGLSWHWLLAVPVFAPLAWYVLRAWPGQLLRASLWIIGGAAAVAGVLEPAWEYVIGGASFDWTFGPTRTSALFTFVLTGLVTYLAVFAALRPRRQSSVAD